MQDTIIAATTKEHMMPDGRVFIAEAKLHQIGGNERPYFSLTGEEWRSQRDVTRHHKSGSEAGLNRSGAMGETLVKIFPLLAIIERLHLSDDTGAPMHAVGNGWYWYSDYDGKGVTTYEHQGDWHTMTPHQRAARYLRVDSIPDDIGNIEEMREYVETLRDQWQVEADEALAYLRSPSTEEITKRLEYLRGQIQAESISYGEIIELESLAEHIDPSDVELLEWAGVPEFPDDETPDERGV